MPKRVLFVFLVLGLLLSPIATRPISAAGSNPFPTKPCWEIFSGAMDLLVMGNAALGMEALPGSYRLLDKSGQTAGYILPDFVEGNMPVVKRVFGIFWNGLSEGVSPAELDIIVRSWAIRYPLEVGDTLILFKEDFDPCGTNPPMDLSLIPSSDSFRAGSYSKLPLVTFQGDYYEAVGYGTLADSDFPAGIGADVLPKPTSLPASLPPSQVAPDAYAGFLILLVALGLGVLIIFLVAFRKRGVAT